MGWQTGPGISEISQFKMSVHSGERYLLKKYLTCIELKEGTGSEEASTTDGFWIMGLREGLRVVRVSGIMDQREERQMG